MVGGGRGWSTSPSRPSPPFHAVTVSSSENDEEGTTFLHLKLALQEGPAVRSLYLGVTGRGEGGYRISVAKLVDGQCRECVPAICSLNICVTPSPGGGGLQNIGGVGWAREKVPPGGGVIPPHMVPAQTGTRQQKGLCSLLVPSPSSHLPATAWLLNMSNFAPPPALNSFRMTYMQWAEVRGISTCMNAWEGFQNANGVRTPQTHKHTDQTGTD